MNEFDWTLSLDWQTFSARLAMTLLHFIWQATVVGTLLAVVLKAIDEASANRRYVASCCALFALPLIALFTFVMQAPPASGSMPSVESSIVAMGDAERSEPRVVSVVPVDDLVTATIEPIFGRTELANKLASPGSPVDVRTASPATDSWPQILRRFAPLLAMAYGAGVIVMFARMLMSFWRGYLLRTTAEPMVGDLPVLVRRLASQMGLRVAPMVAFCERITVPVVVGILKPTILLPASMITSLSTDELAAILSHELAHIRRFDLIVNLVQRSVESLLFFHPVVWWVGRCVNTERENCCDDLAVAAGFANTQYVAALLRMAELCLVSRRKVHQRVAMLSADGLRPSQLGRRVERLLKIRSSPTLAASRVSSLTVGIVIATLVISLAGLSLFRHAEAATPQDEVEETTAAEVVNDAKKKMKVSEQPTGIVWGEPVEGLRLGIRSAGFAKRAASFRHGDWLRYEVWLKNESEGSIDVPGDPREIFRPRHRDGSINVIGSSGWMSFSLPQSAIEAARITIPPGEARQLRDPQCPVREANAKPGRFGPNALALAPAKYPLFAATGISIVKVGEDNQERAHSYLNLRSGSVDIEILPAARLQLRRVGERSAKLTPEQLAKDPSRKVVKWVSGDGTERELVFNQDAEVILDEDDLLSFAGLHRRKTRYNLAVELKASAISRVTRDTKELCRKAESKPMLAILLDGKVLSAATLERSIQQKRANIPGEMTEANAEALKSFLSDKFVSCPCQTTWLKGPEPGFRMGARIDVTERSGRVSGPLMISFLLYNVSGKTQTVRLKLADGTMEVKTLRHGKVVPIAQPLEISKGAALPGDYAVARYEQLEDGLRLGWTVVRTKDGVVTLEQNIESPIVSLTVTEADRDENEISEVKPAMFFRDHLNVMAVGIDDQATTVIGVATSKKVTVRTWDFVSGELRKEVTLETDAFPSQFHGARLTVSSDLSRLLGVVKGQIQIWDVDSGKSIAQLSANGQQHVFTRGLSCTEDLSLIAAGVGHGFSGALGVSPPDCQVAVWDLSKQEVLREFTHPNALQVTSVALSADGRWLASGCQEATTCVFDVQTGERIHLLKNSNPYDQHPDPEVQPVGANQIVCLAFSPDGNQLAIGDMLGVKLVETETGRVTHEIRSPFRYGYSHLVYSKDGRLLTRPGTDKTVPIWSTGTGDLVATLPTESHAGVFSNDGSWYVTGFTDRKQALSVWRLADDSGNQD